MPLQTKLGLCYVHLDQLQQAVEQLQILFRDPLEQDLCLDAADVLRQCGHPAEVTHRSSLVYLVEELSYARTFFGRQNAEKYRYSVCDGH